MVFGTLHVLLLYGAKQAHDFIDRHDSVEEEIFRRVKAAEPERQAAIKAKLESNKDQVWAEVREARKHVKHPWTPFAVFLAICTYSVAACLLYLVWHVISLVK